MIKFKGIVNGVEFDNVKDYNEAVAKAMEDGGTFEASSHTCVEHCDCEQCGRKNNGVVMTLPEIDLDRIHDDDYYKNMKDMLESTEIFGDYLKYVKSLNSEEIADFLAEADKRTSELCGDGDITARAINKITAEMEVHEKALKQLEEKLSLLERAETLIDKSLDMIDSLIDNLVGDTCDDKDESNCDCKGREVVTQQESPSYAINDGETDKLVSSFTKFLDVIFGK